MDNGNGYFYWKWQTVVGKAWIVFELYYDKLAKGNEKTSFHPVKSSIGTHGVSPQGIKSKALR
jgi:hypothetical protein